jgi:hypothetical protein
MIATAAIAALTDSSGILHDQCEKSGCSGDSGQFKGVFKRNIQSTYNWAAAAAFFKKFLQTNASALWTKDQKGICWGGL